MFIYFAVSSEIMDKDYPHAKSNIEYNKSSEFFLYKSYVSSYICDSAGAVLDDLRHRSSKRKFFIFKAEVIRQDLIYLLNHLVKGKGDSEGMSVRLTEMIEVNL